MTFIAAAVLAAQALVPSVEVKCASPGEWKIETSLREAEPGVCIATIRASAPRELAPPRFRAVVSFPQLDVTGMWNPNFGGTENLCPLPWWGNVFNVARTQLLHAWIGPGDSNRMTLAAGVASLGVRYGFAEPGELEAAGADRIVAAVEEIYSAVQLFSSSI